MTKIKAFAVMRSDVPVQVAFSNKGHMQYGIFTSRADAKEFASEGDKIIPVIITFQV